MTERTGLAFAATVLALAIMQMAAGGASARGYEDMTRLEQRIAEFASRGGGHRQPRLPRGFTTASFCLAWLTHTRMPFNE